MVKKKRKLKEKNKIEDKDFEIKFWKDWLYADLLKRQELVKKLPFFKMCLKMKNSKIWKDIFATTLNSYFEDLENAVYIKIRLGKRDNKD